MSFSDACFKDFQLICWFACLVCSELDVGDKLFKHVWERACTWHLTLRWQNWQCSSESLSNMFNHFLLQKSNLILSWWCFCTHSVDDGTAISSGSSTALCFRFLSFILVPTFFWLDCFNCDAAFLSQPNSRFFSQLLFWKGIVLCFQLTCISTLYVVCYTF